MFSSDYTWMGERKQLNYLCCMYYYLKPLPHTIHIIVTYDDYEVLRASARWHEPNMHYNLSMQSGESLKLSSLTPGCRLGSFGCSW